MINSQDTAEDRQFNPSSIAAGRIEATVHSRQQDYLIVNRHELDDLIEEVATVSKLAGLGVFILSGALWLLIEHVATQEIMLTVWSMFLLMTCVIGLIFMLVGARDQTRARRRLRRIIDSSKIQAN